VVEKKKKTKVSIMISLILSFFKHSWRIQPKWFLHWTFLKTLCPIIMLLVSLKDTVSIQGFILKQHYLYSIEYSPPHLTIYLDFTSFLKKIHRFYLKTSKWALLQNTQKSSYYSFFENRLIYLINTVIKLIRIGAKTVWK